MAALSANQVWQLYNSEILEVIAMPCYLLDTTLFGGGVAGTIAAYHQLRQHGLQPALYDVDCQDIDLEELEGEDERSDELEALVVVAETWEEINSILSLPRLVGVPSSHYGVSSRPYFDMVRVEPGVRFFVYSRDEYNEGYHQAEIFTEVLAPLVRQGWDVRCVDGCKVEVPLWWPAEPNVLTLLYSASLCSPMESRDVERIEGWDLSADQVDGFKPSELPEATVIRDSWGTAVAEWIGSSVYILCDLCESSQHVAEILMYLIDRLNLGATSNRPQTPHHDQTVEALLEYSLSRRLQREALAIDRELDSANHNYQAAAARLVNSSQACADLLERQARLRAEVEEQTVQDTARLVGQVEQLAALPLIELVQVVSGSLRVKTRSLVGTVIGRGSRHRLGAYVLELPLAGGVVRVRPLESGSQSASHPHAFPDGTLWLGALDEAITLLLAERQYATAVQMLLEFLEQLDPTTVLVDPAAWPLDEPTTDHARETEEHER